MHKTSQVQFKLEPYGYLPDTGRLAPKSGYRFDNDNGLDY